MKATPLHIQALRGAALLLAVGVGSWLVVSSQRRHQPQEQETRAETTGSDATQETTDGQELPKPEAEPEALDPTFIYGSKSFIPVEVSPPLGGTSSTEATYDASSETFMPSSKSLVIGESAVLNDLIDEINKKKPAASKPKQ